MARLAALKGSGLALILSTIVGCRTAAPEAAKVKREVGTDNSAQKYKDGRPNLTRVSGRIESVREIEVFSEKEGEIIMTLIGFASGDGVILRGLYPGLRKGKSIKLYVRRLSAQYKGTTVYEVIRIEALEPDSPSSAKR